MEGKQRRVYADPKYKDNIIFRGVLDQDNEAVPV